MFAVLKTGGKQYRVEQGDVLRVEKLQADAGDTIQFNEVLVVGDQIGAPLVAGAAVQATVIDQIKGEKVIHFVRRRRKHSSKRTKGHRQQLTLVRVTDILASGADTTGVKAAIGAGSRQVMAAVSSVAALSAAAAPAAEAVTATVRKRARKAAEAVEPVAKQVGDVADRVADTVTDAVEDVTSSTAGKVGLAAAAAGAAGAAAAAVLSGTSAKADESADDQAQE